MSFKSNKKTYNQWDISVFIALILLYHFCFLFRNSIVIYTGGGIADIANYHLPLKFVLFDSIKSFHSIPTWSSQIYAGLPLDCIISGGFYSPINWLLSFLPPFFAFNLCNILAVFIACLGTYLFIRSLGLSNYSAGIGSLIFSFSFFIYGNLGAVDHLSTTACFPLAMYFIEKYLSFPKKKIFLLGYSGVVSLAVLAGHPPKAVYVIIGTFFYFIIKSLISKKQNLKNFSKGFLLLTMSLALSLGLSAMQLVPSLDFFKNTERSTFSLDLITVFSGHPLTLLEFLTPGLFRFTNWGLLGTFLGIIPVLLLFYSFKSKDKKSTLPLWILFFISLLYCLGKYNPLFHFITYIPVLKSFRTPTGFGFIGIFALSTLAAFGFENILSFNLLKRKNIILSLFLFFYLLPILAHYLITKYNTDILAIGKTFIEKNIVGKPPHYHTLDYYLDKLNTSFDLLSNSLNFFTLERMLTFLILIAFFLSLFIYERKIINRLGFFLITACLLVGNLTELKPFSNFVPVKDAIQQSNIEKYLKNDPSDYRIYQWLNEDYLKKYYAVNKDLSLANEKNNEYLLAYHNLFFNIPVIDTQFGIFLKKNNEYLNEVDGQIMVTFGKSTSMNDKERFDRFANNFNLLNILNVKYIISEALLPLDQLKEVFSEKGVHLYENKKFIPLFYLSENIKTYTDFDELIPLLRQSDYDPRKIVYSQSQDFQFPQEDEELKGNIQVDSRSEKNTNLTISTNKPAILVFSENNLPGWTASINDMKTKLYDINYLFKGIIVPKGVHQINFNYNNNFNRLGNIISVVCFLVWVSLIGLYLIKEISMNKKATSSIQ